jgi:[acyl-carrier-protein] S-malonyltransferase
MLQAYAGLPGIEATRADAREALGEAFLRLLDEGPAEQLNLTVNTQPAMLTAGVAAYRAWRALGGPGPEVVAGHSLGEYAALVAAGALGFRDALRLVRFRAEAMQDAVPEGQGAMAAVLGLDDEGVRAACREAEHAAGAREVVQAVNFNAPGQIVIAGHRAAVARALELCKAAGAKRTMALPVSAPFHSSLMQPAAERLRARLAGAPFAPPSTMLLNNVDVADERTPERIKDALVRQAAAPVRWVEIVRRMAALGVSHILECGPGKVLAGLARRIDASLECHALADRGSLEQALASIRGA